MVERADGERQKMIYDKKLKKLTLSIPIDVMEWVLKNGDLSDWIIKNDSFDEFVFAVDSLTE